MSLHDFLRPVTPDAFLNAHYRKQAVVIPADDARAALFSVDELNELLAQSSLWTPATLKIWIDRMAVPADRYCSPMLTWDGEQLRPDPRKIASWLARGASVIMNGAEAMTPKFRALAERLERSLLGYVVANIYFSYGGRQAFDSHYDDHEVFAVQIVGEKTWRVYEGRVDNPVGQPRPAANLQQTHDRAKGALAFEHTLKPGEVMYVPRGQYHDAIATGSASLHVTFSVQPATGLAVLDLLKAEAARESFFRDDLPLDEGAPLSERLNAYAERLAAILRAPQFERAVRQAQQARIRPRGVFNLPHRPEDPRYIVANRNLRMLARGEQTFISTGAQEALVEPHQMAFVRWMFATSDFTLAEAEAEFGALAPGEAARVIEALCEMGVLRQEAGAAPLALQA
jgi:bifunctional lysine-specific demethylase and histidyl-hydroxylase NO66